MGTRSLTVVKDRDKKDLCVLYRQYDGYPEGHGKELATFLKGIIITNGMGADTTNTANGMGCLAAQIVAFFKKEVGHFYLFPSGTRDAGAEFIYTISNKNNKPYLEVLDVWDEKTILQGTPEEVLNEIDTVGVV